MLKRGLPILTTIIPLFQTVENEGWV